MNDLNSVLIEGKLVEDPDSYMGVTVFKIRSKRQPLGTAKAEYSVFEIQAWSKLGEKCLEVLKRGRGVRVVGRLRGKEADAEKGARSAVYIVAEHVEFKPEQKKE